MDLTPATEPLVRAAIREALQPHAEDLVGVSCLAAGSDTTFAEVVLDMGGQLEVIVPAADYRERRADPTHFDDLVARGDEEFAARLQECQAKDGPPVLIRIDTSAGHGAGTALSKMIDKTADEWAFLEAVLK